MKNNAKGITLVAMVITIIVMLILAGVSISAAIGDDGVATKGSKAAVKTKLANVAEDFNLAVTDVQMEYETARTEASTISAYRGVYFTCENLNKVLKESKILTTDTYAKASVTGTQQSIVGKDPQVPKIKELCYSKEEHPIAQYIGSKKLDDLNKSTDYFAMYLSNGANDKSLGNDVFVAVCKLKDGVPILVDLGVVESDIDSTSLVNGKLTYKDNTIKDGTGTGAGKLPKSVRWLNNAEGLEDTK